MARSTRRELLLKGAGAAAAMTTAYALGRPGATLLPGTAGASTGEQATAWNHDPGSLIGPYHWSDVDPGFSACGTGSNQSPVNIDTTRVAALHGPPLLLRYSASELAVENTGHAVEVTIPPGVGNVLQIGPDRYTLAQYHFHALSEHTVNGSHADVEAHFVHTNPAGDVAVVGALYNVGPNPNALLETILSAAPETSGEEGPHMGKANPADLFRGLAGTRTRHGRVLVDSFYAYDGSLTTPSCTENVRWSVASQGGHVSQAAVNRFHDVIGKFAGYDAYPNNNRPVQDLQGRVIRHRSGASRRSPTGAARRR